MSNLSRSLMRASMLAGAVLLTVGGRVEGQLRDPVRVQGGQLTGASTPTAGVRAYLGIPYAAAPVGDRRWKDPVPAPRWQGVREATRFGASCVQTLAPPGGRLPWTTEFMTPGEISEDCLFLNVWTAARTGSARQPVLVYIHGGGFNEGSGAIDVYNGEELAKRGLVTVTVNYRVGPLGFLAHPALTRESPHGASGNYGLLDQIAALRWVKQNIAAFGGDPDRVAVAGQSAGAMSIQALLSSPLAKGLFHRAIIQSGAPPLGAFASTLVAAERAGLAFASSKGASSASELRAIPASELFTVAEGAARPLNRPAIDGRVLPMDPSAAVAAGRIEAVPVLVGMQADESSGLSPATYGKLPVDRFITQARQRFGSEADAYLRLYPSANQEQSSLSQKESVRDQGRVAIHLWAGDLARATDSPIFTYYFSRAIPWPEHPEYGAFHTGEVPYVFGTIGKLNRPWTEADRRLSETVMQYWANFAAAGDPNGPGLPRWPRFDVASRITMELGDQIAPRPVAEPEKFRVMESVLAPASR